MDPLLLSPTTKELRDAEIGDFALRNPRLLLKAAMVVSSPLRSKHRWTGTMALGYGDVRF
jgi:hypothetical protein